MLCFQVGGYEKHFGHEDFSLIFGLNLGSVTWVDGNDIFGFKMWCFLDKNSSNLLYRIYLNCLSSRFATFLMRMLSMYFLFACWHMVLWGHKGNFLVKPWELLVGDDLDA